MLAHALIPITWEAETGRSLRSLGQSGLRIHSKIIRATEINPAMKNKNISHKQQETRSQLPRRTDSLPVSRRNPAQDI